MKSRSNHEVYLPSLPELRATRAGASPAAAATRAGIIPFSTTERARAGYMPAEDLTPEGIQLVIPGAERLQPEGKTQLNLF